MAAPTYVGAGTGAVSTTTSLQGLKNSGSGGAPVIGNVIVVHILQDGTAATAPSKSSFSGVENLAGTDNELTSIGTFDVGIPGSAVAKHHLWIGRAISDTEVSVVFNTSTDDHYIRVYEFSGVHTGTNLSDVIENAATGNTSGLYLAQSGSGVNLADAAVQTSAADRLAVNFFAINDDNQAQITDFAGESGGTWSAPVTYGSATGTDGAIAFIHATMASAGTIDGATDAMDTDGWGVVGFAFKPVVSGTAHSRTPSDTITLSDTPGKAAGLGKSDTVTLSDATSRAWVARLSRADTITLSDTPGKAVGKPAADTITLSDTANVLLILVLQLADTITLSDAHAKAAALAKGDTVTLSDNFARAWTALRSAADTVSLSDTISKGIRHALADTIGTSDALGNAPRKALADTTTLADAIAKAHGVSRSDAVSMADSAVKALGLSRADTVTLTDVIAKVESLAKADTITMSDVIDVDLTPAGGGGLTLSLSDTLTLTDAIVKGLGMSRTDIIQMADSTARALNGIFQEGEGDGVDFRTIFLNRFGIY